MAGACPFSDCLRTPLHPLLQWVNASVFDAAKGFPTRRFCSAIYRPARAYSAPALVAGACVNVTIGGPVPKGVRALVTGGGACKKALSLPQAPVMVGAYAVSRSPPSPSA